MTVTARGLRTRQLILERGARVFDEQGYTGATLNRLVESTGLTRGAFYFHFESKDALAAAIAEEQAARWQQLLVEVERREKDALLRLVTLINASPFAYRDDATTRAAARLLSDQALSKRDLPETAPWWRTTISRLLRQAQEAGQLRDLGFLSREAQPDGADGVDGVDRLAGYILSQLAMIAQVAGAKPGAQFDLLYVCWAMLLPRICSNPQKERDLLELIRVQLDPSTSGPV